MCVPQHFSLSNLISSLFVTADNEHEIAFTETKIAQNVNAQNVFCLIAKLSKVFEKEKIEKIPSFKDQHKSASATFHFL